MAPSVPSAHVERLPMEAGGSVDAARFRELHQRLFCRPVSRVVSCEFQ